MVTRRKLPHGRQDQETNRYLLPCFGGPFLVWHPRKCAELLAEKIKKHKVRVWLVNTGWAGGPYGVGNRFKLSHTRAIIDAIHNGTLARASTRLDPVFGLDVVPECSGVPDEILFFRRASSDKATYDAAAEKLLQLLKQNFKKYGG